jgi:hypothetical protein
MKAWRFALPILTLIAAIAIPVSTATAAQPLSWSHAASMLTARTGMASAVGADGRIYAIGGRNAGGYLASVERYDPPTGVWTAVASMHVARYDAAAVLGPDGRIYVMGGYNPTNGYLATVEAYTPATNAWSWVASMPVARAGLAAVVAADGRIYAIGGNTASSYLNTVAAYSITTRHWTAVAALPTARSGLAAATSADGGSIYAIGGSNFAGALGTVEVYSLIGHTWSAAPGLLVARTDLAATTGAGGRIYVFGGQTAPGTAAALSSVETFLPPLGPWSFTTGMVSARSGFAAVAIGNSIYVLGGVAGSVTQPALATMDVLSIPVSTATAPLPPTVLSTSASASAVTVTWAAPYDGGSAITGYVITAYFGTGTAVAAVVSALAGASSATIGGLTNGTGYTFTVRAQNAVGWGAESPRTVVITPATVPSTPVITGVTTAGGSATVTWTAPFNGGSPITEYLVKAYVGTGSTFAALMSVDGSTTRAVISGLATGTAYSFTVKAANALGWGAESARYTTVVLPTTPTAPTNVLVVGGRGTLSVSWSPPASNGGTPITGYIVTATTGVAGEARSVSVFGTVTTATIDQLAAGKTYSVTVSAVNAVGIGPASAPSTPVTLPAAPGAPRNLSVTPGDTSIQVSWLAPVYDGGRPVMGYTVTVSDGVHSPITVQASGTSTTVSSLMSGTTYTVSVVATNAVGSSAPIIGTVSLRHLPPTLQVPVDQTVDHGDRVIFIVTATTLETGTHLVLTATGLPNGVTFVDQGNGVGTVSGVAEVPAGTYTMTFSVSNGYTPPVVKTLMLTVNRELAVVTPSILNPTVMMVSATSPVARTVTLRASLHEVTDPNGYADIAEAAPVTYTLKALGTGRVYTGTANRSGGGIEATLQTSYTFHNLPVGVYEVEIDVGGQFYQGTGCAFLTVRAPTTHGSVVGDGQVTVSGIRHSFTVNLSYGPSGKVRGSFSYVESNLVQGHGIIPQTYEPVSFLSGHVTGGLVVAGKNAYFQGTATLNGKSGYRFAVMLRGSSVGARFGLTVLAPDHTMAQHSTFPATGLSSGQVAVRV